MKNVRFFANVVKTVAAIAVLGMGLVSCQKDDLADHSNKQEGKAKITVTPPSPVKVDTTFTKKEAGDSTIIYVKITENDSVAKRDSLVLWREFWGESKLSPLETTDATKKGISVLPVSYQTNSIGLTQLKATDDDKAAYELNLKNHTTSVVNFYGLRLRQVVDTIVYTGMTTSQLELEADDADRYTRICKWQGKGHIDGYKEQINWTSNTTTQHVCYVKKNAAIIVNREKDSTIVMHPNYEDIISRVIRTWSDDHKDTISVVTTRKHGVTAIDLKDENVSNFAFTLAASTNTPIWGSEFRVDENDSRIVRYAHNGEINKTISNGVTSEDIHPKYNTYAERLIVTVDGIVFNYGYAPFNVNEESTIVANGEVAREGYEVRTVKNTVTSVYGDDAIGYDRQNLMEKCNIFMVIATPDIDKIEFAGTKVHTNGMAKIDGSVIPVYIDGTKGATIKFKWEKAEEWYWKKDSVIAEGVTFVNQNTGTLTLKGSESKTEKTFATDNEKINIKCNQYDADFQTTVNVDGKTKVTTWHATWYEDFKVCYEGKEVSLSKSSYNVKNADDKLTKDEARSTATTEVWGYSVNGLFNIDEDSRSAYGYGRLTKTIDERVVKTYWDEASKGQSHTVLESTRWATLIREYNTGKKTSQEYKHVFNRLSGSSKWEITAEEGSEAANGSMILENANEENRADDFAHFSLKKFELGQFFNVPGAAQQHDKVTFTESMGAYFEAKDQDGNAIKIFFEDPSYSFTNDVKALTVKSESDSETVYQHENVVNWNFGGATTTLSATGLIHVAKSQETPDFDIEVGSIYASVSRPSNRNASDITAYTYLLVSKDGKKCLPIGIYNNIVTVGEITNMQAGFNSACYVKDQNKVVATRAYSDSGLGMMIWCGADGNPVDAASHITLQGAGFNDRGNDWVNHTGKYAPRATKKGNVTVVTFEGTNVSYTFRGWNV